MKGVILAAGFGTRFLPITKSVPKEMLPLIDKPSIAFVIEELIAAGVSDIVIVTSRRKRALEDFLDRDPELEAFLEGVGAADKIARIRSYPARFIFVRQDSMLGAGHALMLVESVVGDEPFLVAYPDDLHFGATPLARQLIDAYEKTGCTVLSTIHDPPELGRYGVLKIAQDGQHVEDIVEKPAPGTEPSREASIGRYLYTPDLFPLLRSGWERHRGGEYYHVEALRALMRRGTVVHRRIEGDRLDIGAPEGYLEAIVRYAAGTPSYRAVIHRALAEQTDGARTASAGA